jgi:hypothetical protein
VLAAGAQRGPGCAPTGEPVKLAPVTSYNDFFTAAASVAGALTGLLFVALSLTPERLRRSSGYVEHQAIAATAFTSLVDALFLSLSGLMPSGGTQTTLLILGLFGLSSSLGLVWRLWRSRKREKLSKRWPVLQGLIIIIYTFQCVVSFTTSNSSSDKVSSILIIIMFATGIARSWELLGLSGGGLLDLLVHRLDAPANESKEKAPEKASEKAR